MKRKISKGLKKNEEKFVMDMQYGLASSGNTLIFEIARNLHEDIKIKNVIERLCDNLNKFDKEKLLYENYINEIGDIYGEEPIALFDDSDITKYIKYEDKFLTTEDRQVEIWYTI